LTAIALDSYRVGMRRVSVCVLLLSLGGVFAGCGGAPTTPAPTVSVAPETSGDEAAVAEVDARDRHIRELESRLALQTAQVRTLRSELAEARERGESVHIGEATPTTPRSEPAPDFTTYASEEDDDASSGSRPVLRLYGAPTSDVAVLAGPPAPPILPAPPMGAIARLPVVLTPGAPDAVPAIPITPVVVASDVAPPAPADDAIVAEYRAALAYVSARQWELAYDALGRFVAAHPDHAYADNAMYWRGEVLYARRDYAGAITELTAMIERFPHGNKVPDALLRIGFAYQRLGEIERAREMFRRVREQYPGTVAARTAPLEDA
jgi:tol-pal system protein YbgF